MDWNNGYVADIGYTTHFFQEQSPSHLNFACVLNGFEPVAIDKPFTYFELGFGQGLTVNMLAAANPQGRFYAADFNPAHVAAAQELATSAQLDNLTLMDDSFADLADGKVELPQFDFVTMYGVYSWVNAENRRHIVNFLGRYLKPGGIVYVNYNAMPGWSTSLPLQRLVLEHVGLYPGGRDAEFGRARKLIDGLIDMRAGYFADTDCRALKTRLDSVMQDKTAYLAHEYMSHSWDVLYHADVVRDLAAARLDYACSAGLFKAFPHLFLTSGQHELLRSIPDPTLRETVQDYIENASFREDIFVRGARRMAPARQAEWLQRAGLALTEIRKNANTSFRMPTGDMTDSEDLYIAVLDALAEGPRTLAELAALPELRPAGMDKVMEIAAVLISSKQVSPCFTCSARMETGPAMRMNRAIAQHALIDDSYQALVSPLLGSGVGSGLIQRLVYRMVSRQPDGVEVDIDALIGEVCRTMDERKRPILRNGKPIDSLEDRQAEIGRIVRAILEKRVPVWRQLGVL